MPEEFCDCGSAIPDDASFCPGCGKPLTEDARERERRANAFPPRKSEKETEPVDTVTFATPGALRSCYWSAAFAAILMSLPLAPLLCFLIYPGAGFFSVHSFRRQTKREVNVRAGAKLGFLTGVITFALILILLTIVSVMPGSPGLTGVLDQMEDGFRQEGQPEVAEQFRQMRESPGALAAGALMGLTIVFAATTMFTMAGGALGAKILKSD